MFKFMLLLCLSLLSIAIVGCSSSTTKDIGDTKTRESETRDKMQNVLASDPTLKPPSGANSAAMPHAAPPGAPMGSAH